MSNIRQTIKGLDYTMISYFPISIKGEQKLKFRVKFLSSRNEQVVSDLEYQSGNFVDEQALLDSVRLQSVVTDGKSISSIVQTNDSITIIADKIDLEGSISTNDYDAKTIADKINEGTDSTINIGHKINLDGVVNVNLKSIVAVEPSGHEISFLASGLAMFSKKHRLDMDAIQLVLDGKRKTHKQWTFKYE